MATQPTLTSARLVLRPFSATDAPRLVELARDPSIANASLDMPNPLDTTSAESWILELAEAWNRRFAAAFAITRGDSPLLGAVTLLIDPHERSADIGYWVGRPFRRQGICSEAVQRVVDFGFDSLALLRISASHAPANLASRRVAQLVGMRLESVSPDRESHVVSSPGAAAARAGRSPA